MASETDTYDVFVSYSRHDKVFANAMGRALINFNPAGNKLLPKNRLKLFLDTRDLIGPDYMEAIETNLEHSRTLLLICSPSSARSDYVAHEITSFSNYHGITNIIPVIIDGVPNNELKTSEVIPAGSGTDSAAEVPEANQAAFSDALLAVITVPLAIDYRGYDVNGTKVDRGISKHAWHSVLARIFGVSRRELERREYVRTRNRYLVTGSITGVVILSLMAISAYALYKEQQASKEATRATNSESQTLSALAVNESKAGNATTGVALAIAALNFDGLTTESRKTADLALSEIYPQLHTIQSIYNYSHHATIQEDNIVAQAFLNEGNLLVAATNFGTIGIADADTGSPLYIYTSEYGQPKQILTTRDSNSFAVVTDTNVMVWREPTGKPHRVFGIADTSNQSEIRVRTAALSHTSRQLALGTMAGDIYLTNIDEDAQPLKLMSPKNNKTIATLIFSDNDAVLLSVSGNGKPQLWDTVTGNHVKSFAPATERFTGDRAGDIGDGAAQIATTGFKSEVILWDTVTGAATGELAGHLGDVRTVKYSPDNRYIGTAAGLEAPRLWHADTGDSHVVLAGNEDYVYDLTFSSDSSMVAASSRTGITRIWSVRTGRELSRFNDPEITSGAPTFSPDNRYVATGNYKGEVIVWRTEHIYRKDLHAGNAAHVENLSFSADGKLLAGHIGNTLKVWEIPSGKSLLSYDNTAAYTEVMFLPDSMQLITGDVRGWVHAWQISTGKQSISEKYHSGYVSNVAFAGDSSIFATSSTDGKLIVWSSNRATPIKVLAGGQDEALSVDIDAGSNYVAMGTRSGVVTVFDTRTWEPLISENAHSEMITSLTFSRDGDRLISRDYWGADAVLWNIPERKQLTNLASGDNSRTRDAFFSVDQQLAIRIANDGYPAVPLFAERWDSTTGEMVDAITSSDAILEETDQSGTDSDNAGAVIHSGDKLLQRWDAEKRLDPVNLNDTSITITTHRYSPDGTRLLTLSDDNTLRLWDLADNSPVALLASRPGGYRNALFSPDGQYAVVITQDNSVTLMDLSQFLSDPKVSACHRLAASKAQNNAAEWRENAMTFCDSLADNGF